MIERRSADAGSCFALSDEACTALLTNVTPE